MSEQNNKQVNFQSDSEPNQISVGIEETNLLSVKDVERIMPENETQIARLIQNHTFMEPGEYEGTGDTRKKLSVSNFQNDSEELSSGYCIHLISEKVKEKVEKTQFLKAKLQRIIGRTCLFSVNSSVTKAVSKLYQTPLGLDYMSGGTEMMLPEKEHPNDLDFSINILVIGKTGVGKSATVNSIFGETKSPVGAFGVTTKSANYVIGNLGGILVRILDTPGLMSAATEEQYNQEVLMSIKTSMRTFPLDVILYINRLDDKPDIHLIRLIDNSLGSSIWRKTIVVLTHTATDVPDSISYKDVIAQRSSLMHQSIRQAVPELSKMPEIVLAENNISSFYGNITSESSFSNWRLNLLILCCSVKNRSKARSSQNQDTQLRSFAQFCSLWDILLLGAKSRHTSHSHDDFADKKRYLVDSSYSEILWDEQNQQCIEQETLLEPSKKPGLEKGRVLSRVRTRRGRLGFQVTKRFGIYLDTTDFHTGISIRSGGYKKEEQEGKMLLKMMRGSISVLGLVPMVISLFTSVYGRKDI